MNIYERKQRWKLFLFVGAILIGAGSLAYTNKLVNELAQQERKTVELWAEAMKILINADPEYDLSFPLSVIENNRTIPVLLTNGEGSVINYINIDSTKMENPDYREKLVDKMKTQNDPLVISLGNDEYNYIYYSDSVLLNRLLYFPYIQLAVIILFILVSYFAFSSSRKAEQNKVWVGLSKETAHQLGTPTTSLNGWVEILKQGDYDKTALNELEKDIKRLERITERFSKIGSKPVLKLHNLNNLLKNSVNYLKTRSSERISFVISSSEDDIMVPLNEALFEWVIENVCKNAMDAIAGKGKIVIDIQDHVQVVYVDISDNGKGIPKSKYKTIFKPGYTTKERGWGLGLSLSKRIVETYHEGKIFVLNSELDVGTTLRIVLKKDSFRK